MDLDNSPLLELVFGVELDSRFIFYMVSGPIPIIVYDVGFPF